jgi:hypothetical protein
MPLGMVKYCSLPILGTRFGFNHREKEQRTTKNAIGMVHIVITTINTPCKFETILFSVPTELILSNTFHHRVETRPYNIIPLLWNYKDNRFSTHFTKNKF